MFGFRRHRPPFLGLLLALLGFKFLTRNSHRSDAERAELKAKSREFRAKLRDAFAVWDCEEPEAPASSEGQQ